MSPIKGKAPGLERIRLENVSVVLVQPLYAGNMGSVARAMNNMGIRSLALVDPPDFLGSDEAIRMAVGSLDILKSASIHRTLREALEPFAVSVAASRRGGRNRRPDFQPRAMAETLVPLSQKNRIALVFGREDNGLTNEEMALCNYMVTIPTSEAMGSMNLAAAVTVCCYELFVASLPAAEFRVKRLSSSVNLEAMYDHIQAVLVRIGFLDENNPVRIMSAIRKILSRSGLDERDTRILRGIFRDINNKMNILEKGKDADCDVDGRRGVGDQDQ